MTHKTVFDYKTQSWQLHEASLEYIEEPERFNSYGLKRFNLKGWGPYRDTHHVISTFMRVEGIVQTICKTNPTFGKPALFIAGGAVRDWAFSMPVKDYDFFLIPDREWSEPEMGLFVSHLANSGLDTEGLLNPNYCKESTRVCSFTTGTFRKSKCELMICNNKKGVKGVLEGFDINICKHAFGRRFNSPCYYLINNLMPSDGIEIDSFNYADNYAKTFERFQRFDTKYNLFEAKEHADWQVKHRAAKMEGCLNKYFNERIKRTNQILIDKNKLMDVLRAGAKRK